MSLAEQQPLLLRLKLSKALVHAPALEKITKAEAAEIESLAVRHHGGTVERGRSLL
jgi:hypothetical protein